MIKFEMMMYATIFFIFFDWYSKNFVVIIKYLFFLFLQQAAMCHIHIAALIAEHLKRRSKSYLKLIVSPFHFQCHFQVLCCKLSSYFRQCQFDLSSAYVIVLSIFVHNLFGLRQTTYVLVLIWTYPSAPLLLPYKLRIDILILLWNEWSMKFLLELFLSILIFLINQIYDFIQ